MRQWLKNLREQNKWTQLDVAKKLEISEAYYSFIENGTRQKKMDISLVSKLSAIFDVSIQQIVEWEEHGARE